MEPPTDSAESPVIRVLNKQAWQGIGAIATIVGLVLPLAAGLGVALFELVTGNVRVLLWLQLQAWAAPLLVVGLLATALAALRVWIAEQKVYRTSRTGRRRRAKPIARYPQFLRRGALGVFLLAFSLVLLLTAGYAAWTAQAQAETIVLIADFLDPDEKDSSDVTRELVTQTQESLASFDNITVRALGWAVADSRGEGSADAQRIGQAAQADIVIWGDYRVSPEFVAYVHFNMLDASVPVLALESARVFGNQQVKDAALFQRQSMPESYAFNVALGEHVGALVAFASGVTLANSGKPAEGARFLDIASQIYGNPLTAQIEPAIRFWRAFINAELGNDELARDEYTAVLDTIGQFPSLTTFITFEMVHNNRGLVRDNLGDSEGALNDFNRAMELNSAYAAPHNNRGIQYYEQGKYAEAIQDYTKAIELDPQYAAAYHNRAIVYKNQGNLALARADYDKAIEINPAYTSAYVYRGILRKEQGDSQGALDDYSRAIEIDPENVTAYMSRAVVRAQQGDVRGARSDYEKAFSFAPTNSATYSQRGSFRLNTRDWAGAISDFTTAIGLDATNDVAYHNRGVARSAQGDNEGAIADYQRAIELDPDYAPSYVALGMVRSEVGQLAEALENLNEAIELAPNDAQSYFVRGAIRQGLKDWAGASDDFRRYLALAPDVGNREAIEKTIADLESKIGVEP